MGFPGISVVKNLPANAGDVGFIPGLGKSAGEKNHKSCPCPSSYLQDLPSVSQDPRWNNFPQGKSYSHITPGMTTTEAMN